MATKLSNRDKKDLDKFTKFLALKSTQIIVQSRQGLKDSTACKPHMSGSDWFNLNVRDIPEILTEAKKIFNHETITTEYPLCVEISLRTAEGDSMVLESWCLALLPEQCDPAMRIVHTVYNRMGILLKSLVSVTRVTPAYKLSRRQGPDTYVLCYRLYLNKPPLHTLGEGFKQVRIGQICTPIGTIQLSVAYRTKMTISPTQSGKDNSIMLKSDHFNTNLSPKNLRYEQNEENNSSISSLFENIKVGAFADPSKLPPRPPQPELPGLTIKLLEMTKKAKERELAEQAERKTREQAALAQKEAAKAAAKVETPTDPAKAARLSKKQALDEIIMADFKPPFATPTATTELVDFYRMMKRAPRELPMLQGTSGGTTAAEAVEEFQANIEKYEQQIKEMDELIASWDKPSEDDN